MKRILLTILAIGLLSTGALAGEAPELKTARDRQSYAVGVDIGRNFKNLGIDIDVDILARAMKEMLAGQKPALSDKELRALMAEHQLSLREKSQIARKARAAENKAAGIAFLEENKKKEGVVALPSGLQYKILKAGTGKMPSQTDTIEVSYRGTLLDGTEFDSSPEGKSATFKVTGVILGWREALKVMPVGSKWQLFIPPQLAYGDRGAGRDIGPNSTLIFEVELVGIK